MPPSLNNVSSAYDIFGTGRSSDDREAIVRAAQAIRGGGGNRSIVDAVAKLLTEYRAGAMFTDPDLNPDAIRRKRAEAREKVTATANALKESATRNLRNLRETLRAGSGDQPADTQEALLRAMSEQRAFARLEREFGRGLAMNVDRIIQRAGAEGDLDTLRALRSEVRSVMHAAFEDERTAESSTQTYLTLIEQAERPHLSPEARWHREQLDVLATWEQAVNHNLGVIDYALGDPSGSSTFPLLALDGSAIDNSPGYEGMSGTSVGGAAAVGGGA